MNCGAKDVLSSILKQTDYQYEFLIGVVYRLVKEDDISSVRHMLELHTAKEIQSYLSRTGCDMIILTCPEHLPVFWNRAEQGWVKFTEEPLNSISKANISELLLVALS